VIKGRLLVQFADDVSVSSTVRSFGRVSVGSPAVDAVFLRHGISEMKSVFPWRKENSQHAVDRQMSKHQQVELPLDADLDEVINDLLATGKVLVAEKDWAQPLLGSMLVPDDEDWGLQYCPTLIGAASTWDVEPGSDTVKIAIIDSGVNYNHEDLKDMIWVNPGEDVDGDEEVYDTDDLNGIDDDGNGIIDDLIGYDFYNGVSLPPWPGEDATIEDTDPNDFDGHGTHCSGIAAASTNNTLGVAGIAGGINAGGAFHTRGARIMCLRAGGSANDDGSRNGFVSMADCAQAIDYAATMGADVINCSWGSSNVTALFNAINLALDSGIVISKAAGNGNPGIDSQDYMGGFPGVMAVASTNAADQKSSFSYFGTWIEISAPGSSIRSTYSSDYVPVYATLSGTSMAAPAYCGAVALLKSLMPHYTRNELDSTLMATATDIDGLNPGFEEQLGAGRVDILDAIQGLPVANFNGGPDLIGEPGLSVDFTDLSPNSPSAWSWTFGDGNVSALQNPTNVYSAAGVYDVSLEVTEPNGTGYELAKRMVLVHSDTLIGDTIDGMVGETVAIPVRLKNDFLTKSLKIPIKYADAGGGILTWSHFSTSGLAIEDWEFQAVPSFNPFGKELAIDLRSNIGIGSNGHSTYLPAGDQTIVYMHFTIDPASTPGAVVPITTKKVGSHTLAITNIHASYAPVFGATAIRISGCCETPGDADNSGSVTIADVTFLIARIFAGGPAPDCQDEGDADGGGSITIADATYLIARIFSGGPAPICGNTGS
jgi:subtilisin family serine protease